MKAKVVLASRLILGLIFLVFGANGLMMFILGNGFIPTPPPPPEMEVIFKGFEATKYLLILVKALEVIAGLLFLSGRFMNLAITLITPIVVNILGIHLFAAPSGLPVALVIVLLLGILIQSRWATFKLLLSSR